MFAVIYIEQHQQYMIDLSKFDSLISIATYFDTEAKCKKVLREQRWGKYIVCPYCGSIHAYERKDGRFICKDCNASFQNSLGESLRIPRFL